MNFSLNHLRTWSSFFSLSLEMVDIKVIFLLVLCLFLFTSTLLLVFSLVAEGCKLKIGSGYRLAKKKKKPVSSFFREETCIIYSEKKTKI